MTTKIEPTVADAVALVEQELSGKTKKELDKLSAALDLTLEEFIRFQELKSIAAGGILQSEDAMYIYHQLGGSPTVFNGRSFAVKYVLTQVFGKLLQININARG